MSNQQIIDHLKAIEAGQGPVAKARAEEIAGMEEFGVLEFLELTGIDPGRYGIYTVDEQGIRLGLTTDDSCLTGHQKIDLRTVRKKLFDLNFPCSPEDFSNWYATTYGENGVSDFPIAEGFLKALGKKLPHRPANCAAAVPSTKIIEAFAVMSEIAANHRWWSDRMRSAKRYGLLDARASQGGRGRGKPSYWHPLVVAVWLIEKSHLNKRTVIHAVRTHFPECNVDYLEDI